MTLLTEQVVVIDDVSFTYPPPYEIQALKNVNVEIGAGEIVAIIGQNGSGKSTLAKCVAGFLKPDTGTIKVEGVEIHRVRQPDRARHVGYVFQNPDHQLFKETVWQDAAFGLENLKLDRETIEKRVTSTLKHLGLYSRRDLHPQRLAKGDKQRLAVADVAVMEPPVVIVDEPTTGQDPQRARDVMDLLMEMNKNSGTTVLVITHAMDLVAEYAERTIVLFQGEILIDGTVKEVFSQVDLLARTFIEPPPVAVLGMELGLNGIPITVDEAANLLYERAQR